MKLEIDFSRPDELRRQKRDLEMALSTIEAALRECEKNSVPSGQATLPSMEVPPAKKGASLADTLLAGVPDKFTMREAIDSGATFGMSSTAVRKLIALIATEGAIELIEKGQGRKPSSFKKL